MHDGVDVAVDVAVEGVGRARRQRAADDGRDDEPEVGHALLGEEHDGDRRDEEQLDDPRLHQRDVLSDEELHPTAVRTVERREIGAGVHRCHEDPHRWYVAPTPWVREHCDRKSRPSPRDDPAPAGTAPHRAVPTDRARCRPLTARGLGSWPYVINPLSKENRSVPTAASSTAPKAKKPTRSTTTRTAKTKGLLAQRDPGLPLPVARKAGWSDLDVRAVDTTRLLAADAVQKVGNGHPGTAMSLAPLAYLLYQNVMTHDPSDPAWLGRDRFVLVLRALEPDAVHPALPQRLRPLARRPQVAAHVGLADPRPPRGPPHPRCRDHDRPARLGPRLRRRHGDGPAPPARPLRPGREAGHEPLRPPRLRHRLRRRHAGGRLPRGLRPRRPPGARQPHRRLRRQPDLHRGRHRHRVQRGRRRALRGLRLARRRGRLAQGRRRRDLRRGRRRAARRDPLRRQGDRQADPRRAAHDHRVARADEAEHRQVPRLGPRRRGGRRHQGAARLRPEEDLRRRARRPQARPRRRQAGQGRPPRVGQGIQGVAQGQPRPRGPARPHPRGPGPGRSGRRRCRPSRPTRRASRPAPPPARCSPPSPTSCRSCGAAPPTSPSPTTRRWRVSPPSSPRASRPASGRADRSAAPCTSASARTGWA